MNRRGITIVSTLFGLFALCFGVLGAQALTLGPDAPRPTETQIAQRVTAANALERSIDTTRANVPPALPAVPDRISVPVAATGGGPAPVPAAAQSQAAPTQAAPERESEYDGGRDQSEEGDDDDD